MREGSIGVRIASSPTVPVGRDREVVLEVFNRSDRGCSSVEVSLKLPSRLYLVRGSNSLTTPHLAPGQATSHQLILRARSAGVDDIAVTLVTYVDSSGRWRHDESHPPLHLEASGVRPADVEPTQLEVRLADQPLQTGAWQRLVGSIEHVAGPAVSNAQLAISDGGLTPETDTPPIDVGPITAGGSASFAMVVGCPRKRCQPVLESVLV